MAHGVAATAEFAREVNRIARSVFRGDTSIRLHEGHGFDTGNVGRRSDQRPASSTVISAEPKRNNRR